MDAKFLILVAISTVLVAAIYSSSMRFVFGDTFCSTNAAGNTMTCVKDTEKGKKAYACLKDDKWVCTLVGALGPVPPDLRDAINKAQSSFGGGATTGENNTSATTGKTLKPGGVLKGGETDNNPPTNPTNSNDTLQ